jgi:fluoroacetyl-CoA thioesterase
MVRSPGLCLSARLADPRVSAWQCAGKSSSLKVLRPPLVVHPEPQLPSGVLQRADRPRGGRTGSVQPVTEPLAPGLSTSHEFVVEGRLLTDVGGTLGFSVLSTPGMIAMMERAAAMLVYPGLEEGQATVGFEVCVKHVRGQPEGATCTAHAELLEVEGRKLRFAVEVTAPDGSTVGVGTHERRVISATR